MAASVKHIESDSSSSDDEALRRCQEAVWETRSVRKKDADSNVPHSKRVVVANHEHDGNELQVTKGFQTHVAKKLVHLLDSSITEWQNKTLSCVESTHCDDDDDEGFRLFSTSVPGQAADDPPTPVRRRPVPSSSDSDSEMETRLREAAVSVRDLIPTSSLPSMPSVPSAELPKVKKNKAQEEESHVIKKKKKKKAKLEEEEQVNSVSLNSQRNGEHSNSEQEHTKAKVKRKKKQKLHTEEEALN